MSYTPTEWKAGDTVTSAKLNKLEQGVANSGGGIIVEEEMDGSENSFLNVKAGVLKSAIMSGKIVYVHESAEMGGTDSYNIITTKLEFASGQGPGKYVFGYGPYGATIFFVANDDDSYPVRMD